LKKISFSIGGLASSSSQFNNIDQLDHIQVLLPPTSFKNVAVALPQDHSTCLTGYSDTVLYEYDNENDDLYCYLADFPLEGETDEEFARHHWMIDSGCTDHLSPFKDDFAHLQNQVQHTIVANGQRVPSTFQGIRTSCSE
jgi:hypothetical protein